MTDATELHKGDTLQLGDATITVSLDSDGISLVRGEDVNANADAFTVAIGKLQEIAQKASYSIEEIQGAGRSIFEIGKLISSTLSEKQFGIYSLYYQSANLRLMMARDNNRKDLYDSAYLQLSSLVLKNNWTDEEAKGIVLKYKTLLQATVGENTEKILIDATLDDYFVQFRSQSQLKSLIGQAKKLKIDKLPDISNAVLPVQMQLDITVLIGRVNDALKKISQNQIALSKDESQENAAKIKALTSAFSEAERLYAEAKNTDTQLLKQIKEAQRASMIAGLDLEDAQAAREKNAEELDRLHQQEIMLLRQIADMQWKTVTKSMLSLDYKTIPNVVVFKATVAEIQAQSAQVASWADLEKLSESINLIQLQIKELLSPKITIQEDIPPEPEWESFDQSEEVLPLEELVEIEGTGADTYPYSGTSLFSAFGQTEDLTVTLSNGYIVPAKIILNNGDVIQITGDKILSGESAFILVEKGFSGKIYAVKIFENPQIPRIKRSFNIIGHTGQRKTIVVD